jgi:hypothetical protein
MKKYFVVDLLGFFKNKTTEICHLDSRRHFELHQKKSYNIFQFFEP